VKPALPEVTNVTLKTAAFACVLAGWHCLACAQAPPAAGTAESLYLKLQSLGLDKGRVYKVREANIDRASIHLSLEDGVIAFSEDVDGRMTGAFFHGDGEILLSPANSTERASMALFTGAAILEEKFSTAYFRFNDDLYGEIKNSLRAPDAPADFVSRWNTTAQNLGREDALRLLSSFIDQSPSSAPEPDRFFHAYLQGDRLGSFDASYDSLSTEQVGVGAHRIMKGQDFYDVWASFATTRPAGKNAARIKSEVSVSDFDIRDFKIRAQVRPPTKLEANASLTIVPRRNGRRLLLFELSRLLEVSRVEADGQPVEYIHNPSIEGSQLARRGNNIVAVVLPSPMRLGEKFRLDFDYSGEVLSEAANGLLYVGEHGTWYPNIGMVEASYDMEFRYPAGWTLVATGHRLENRSEGTEQVSRWVSERPIPIAGFNLGKYSHSSARAGAASVIAYACKNVERSFPRLSQPPADESMEGLIGTRPRLFQDPQPEQPSPARNAQAVANAGAKAVEFYQQRFGAFPYSELALTQFPGRISQGWPGLVFLASYAFLTPEEQKRYQPDSKLRLELEQTTAHEVAHQWWGDLISWRSYRDQWMMEALANYSALMLLESENPAQFRQLMQKYRDDLLAKDHGREVAEAGPVTLGLRLSSSQFPNGYEVISYGRGTWLVHMLRCMLRDADRNKPGRGKNSGDELFLRALRKLTTEYHGKQISSTDLINLFASELPQSLWYEGRPSLNWFEESWVNGSAVPGFALHELKLSSRAGATIATGVIVQDRAPDTLVTAVPLYAVIASKPVFLARVFAEGHETPFRLTAPTGTRKLVLDPEDTLLARSR
jgi:Peptidase family M1 domain